MIVLDTNVISAMMRRPEPRMIQWLDAQPLPSLWTTSIFVYEIEYGLQTLPLGRRRKWLQRDFEQALREDLDGRVLDFDAAAASQAASISAHLRAIGRPVDVRDVMIAGIVASRNAVLATRNTKHFADTQIQLINPWDDDFD